MLKMGKKFKWNKKIRFILHFIDYYLEEGIILATEPQGFHVLVDVPSPSRGQCQDRMRR